MRGYVGLRPSPFRSQDLGMGLWAHGAHLVVPIAPCCAPCIPQALCTLLTSYLCICMVLRGLPVQVHVQHLLGLLAISLGRF